MQVTIARSIIALVLATAATTVAAEEILCNGQKYNSKQYKCFDDLIACPQPKTQLCGTSACYNPRAYHCENGVLVEGSEQSTTQRLVANSTSGDLAGFSQDVTDAVTDGTNSSAPGKLVQQLATQNITAKEFKKVQTDLASANITLSATQIVTILGDADGPISGFQKYAASRTAKEKSVILAILPQVADDLGLDASALSGLSQDVEANPDSTTAPTTTTGDQTQNGHSNNKDDDSTKKSDPNPPKNNAATLNASGPWLTILTIGSMAFGFGFSFTLLV